MMLTEQNGNIDIRVNRIVPRLLTERVGDRRTGRIPAL
jgi:hypothetical protein